MHKKIKILVIVPSEFCFGLQNLTLSFFSRLSTQAEILFLNAIENDGEFPERVRQLGFSQSFTWFGTLSRKLDSKNIKRTVHRLIRLPKIWYDFLKIYRECKPDIIYFGNFRELILFWPFLAFIRNKVVCHMHDPPPNIFFQRLSFRFWSKGVGHFIFISNNVRTRLRILGKISASEIVIHNGIEINEIIAPRVRSDMFAKRFGWPADCVIVGITGQMHLNKGHQDFIDAATRCAQINRRLRFVIGGKPSGPDYFRIAKYVESTGMNDLFGFSGWLNRSGEFFNGLDIFVLASRHDEGFGLVVAEAMERAVPVIATKSGGAVEIIKDKFDGYLIEKRAPQELANAILNLANDKALRTRMGESARNHIIAEFNIARKVKDFSFHLSGIAQPAANVSRYGM